MSDTKAGTTVLTGADGKKFYLSRESAEQTDNGDGTGSLVGLPMPHDVEMLLDPAKRRKVVRGTRQRFPFPVPNGWFVVAASSELKAGETKPLYYFGKDLVLFRARSGKPKLLDAHCPHLGAHLAVGGKVVDESIQCPFHGWRFDGTSGSCVEVPYDDNPYIPKTATARAYPVVEKNKMIWAWHHGAGEPPSYQVPDVPEFDDPEWSPIEVLRFPVATCCQEMAENNVDWPHFKYVHGTPNVPEEDFMIDGAYKRSIGMKGRFVRESFGLGLGVLRLRGFTTFVSSTTPVDTENVDVRWIFTAPKANGPDAAKQAAEAFAKAVSQDIPIWENKIFKDPPVLRPAEKPVTEQRRWADQFYTWPDDAPRKARRA